VPRIKGPMPADVVSGAKSTLKDVVSRGTIAGICPAVPAVVLVPRAGPGHSSEMLLTMHVSLGAAWCGAQASSPGRLCDMCVRASIPVARLAR